MIRGKDTPAFHVLGPYPRPGWMQARLPAGPQWFLEAECDKVMQAAIDACPRPAYQPPMGRPVNGHLGAWALVGVLRGRVRAAPREWHEETVGEVLG